MPTSMFRAGYSMHGLYGLCRLDALAEVMHEDFGTRSEGLWQRRQRVAVFIGAHCSEDLCMHAEHGAWYQELVSSAQDAEQPDSADDGK